MSNLFNIFKGFITSLTMMDILFLLAMFALIILMIVLIYYIKINQDIPEEKEETPITKEPTAIEKQEDTIISSMQNDYDDEEGELLDLEALTKQIKEKQLSTTEYDKYEQEQEQKAIISYDELLERANKNVVKYLNDKDTDQMVKKIDIDHINNIELNSSNNKPTNSIALVSYEQEEAFLAALKKLQNQLLN